MWPFSKKPQRPAAEPIDHWFEIGDIVRCGEMTGAPEMMVAGMDEDTSITCDWFVEGGWQRCRFWPEMLLLVMRASPDSQTRNRWEEVRPSGFPPPTATPPQQDSPQ